MKKKIIIDCDVGIDDALALILAFHSLELQVMAVTGVNGNVSLEKVMKNIRKVLSLLQPSDRPFVARGAERPLTGRIVHAVSYHGEDGLGGVEIRQKEGGEWWKSFPGTADELIGKMARQHPGDITLIAIGPLTNLALGLEKDPEGMGRLKEIVIMGGAVRTGGNITPHAEFNFFVDPLAAKRVLESGLPITLVPLDATHQVPLTAEIMDRLRKIQNLFSGFVVKVTGYDPETRRFREGREFFYLHDPLAVGVAVNPGLVEKEKLSLSVKTEEGEEYGKLLELPGDPALEKQRVNVCLEVATENFLELFISRLAV
jgi:pyrimidine-specific ribonucleoside hydrolase